MKSTNLMVLGAIVATLWSPAPGRLARAGTLERLLELTMQANKAAAQSQDKVDAAAEKTADLVTQYRALQEQIRSLEQYNHQVETLVASQEGEMLSLDTQIEEAADIGRKITPLMVRMIDSLENFIDLDVPFLLEERHKRTATLRQLMSRADVTDSERYRRILEAYQIENEYGRTIEAYPGTLEGADGGQRTLNFLRIGRVAFMYQTLDGSESAVWDQTKRSWEQLSSAYRSGLQKGFRMARKQAAPDLLRLPIPTPVDASSKQIGAAP